jgi:hypothetical protein
MIKKRKIEKMSSRAIILIYAGILWIEYLFDGSIPAFSISSTIRTGSGNNGFMQIEKPPK